VQTLIVAILTGKKLKTSDNYFVAQRDFPFWVKVQVFFMILTFLMEYEI